MNRAVTNISTDIRKLPDECKISIQYGLLEKSRKEIHDANNGMLGVTKIVDLLAKRNAINDNLSPHQFLASDGRFSTIDTISLSIIIEKLKSLLGINTQNSISNKLSVSKFLPGNKSPAKQFYENIILEAFLNYDKRKTGDLTISELLEDSKSVGLIFTNPYECSIDELSMPAFIEVSTAEFKGAILYYHLFLKQYEMGKILYKRTCKNKIGSFELYLYLNHLIYEKQTENTALAGGIGSAIGLATGALIHENRAKYAQQGALVVRQAKHISARQKEIDNLREDVYSESSWGKLDIKPWNERYEVETSEIPYQGLPLN